MTSNLKLIRAMNNLTAKQPSTLDTTSTSMARTTEVSDERELAPPPGSAKFVPDGDGLSAKSKEAEIVVYAGKTKHDNEPVLLVDMKYGKINRHRFLLTYPGAVMLHHLLAVKAGIMSPNAPHEPRGAGK